MIRNLVSFRSVSLIRRSFASNSIGPSPTTCLLLKGLSPATTEDSLKNALSGLSHPPRAIEIEPGCSLQFLNQCEADVSANAIKSALGYKTEVANAVIPSLNLHNIPLNTTSESLINAFRAQRPKKVHLVGGLSVEFVVVDAASALRISRVLEGITLEGQKLEMTAADAEKLVVKEVTSDDSLQVLQLTSTPAACKSIKIRLSADDEKNVDKIKETLKAANVTVSDSRLLDLPAVIIRNIGFMEEQHVRDLFVGMKYETLNLVRKSKDSFDHVVAYFNSEKDALHCLGALKGVSVNERKLSAVYREIPQPTVTLTNLPADVTQEEVAQFMGVVQFSKIKLSGPLTDETKKNHTYSNAVVHVASVFEAKLARNALNRKPIRNRAVTVQDSEESDLEMTVTVDANSTMTDKELMGLLQPLGVVPKSLVHESNRHAFVDFLTANEANNALNNFNKGSVSLAAASESSSSSTEGGVVTASLTGTPAYILQVADLPTSSPASTVVDTVLADKAASGVNILKVDRNGAVKCKRARDLIGTMKQIKPLKVDGLPVIVEKYRPLLTPGDSAYDGLQNEEHDFDQFSLRTVLKDFLYSDPATRYEIARNYFERALNDATALSDITKILDEDASHSMKEETKNLLFINSQKSGDDEEVQKAKKRLFELFLQREEMQKFAHDFREIEAFLGPINESDSFDWAKFHADTEDDINLMKEQTQKLHAKQNQELLEAIRGQNPNDPWVLEMDDIKVRQAEKAAKAKRREEAERRKQAKKLGIDPNEPEEEEQVVSLLDPEVLRDREGNFWSGVVLDTDMTQKTMPGGRVMRHRALVMIGNNKGAGGFGMGKAQTPADAINAAFRSALGNIIHVDLYENFGFAHDLHGKFNSCHCYIRATGRDRDVRGSAFADEVLTRFGVASYSCKFVGRRDPYAMINALFKALQGHENIDEFAKDRGKRYLTLKWAYNNKV